MRIFLKNRKKFAAFPPLCYDYRPLSLFSSDSGDTYAVLFDILLSLFHLISGKQKKISPLLLFKLN